MNKFMKHRGFVLLVLTVFMLSVVSQSMADTITFTEAKKDEIIDVNKTYQDEESIEWEVTFNQPSIENEGSTIELHVSEGLSTSSLDANGKAKIDETKDGYRVSTPAGDDSYTLKLTTMVNEKEEAVHEVKAKATVEGEEYEASEQVDAIDKSSIENSEENEIMKESIEEDSEKEIEEKPVEKHGDDTEDIAIEDETDEEDELNEADSSTTVNPEAFLSLASISDAKIRNLIIDPNAISNNMTVETASGTAVRHKTTGIYENFKGTASKEITYSKPSYKPGDFLTYGRNNNREVITVTYDHVGYLEVENIAKNEDLEDCAIPLKEVEIGARMVISDIRLGAGPRWRQDFMTKPRIELSNNFYSGIFYEFIEVMNLEIQFFEKENPSNVISFDDESNGLISFLSLNGYGYVPNNEWGLSNLIRPGSNHYYDKTYEFVGSLDGVQGILSEPVKLPNGEYTKGTRLDYHEYGSGAHGPKEAANKTYYMDKNLPPSPDNPDGNVNWFYVFEDKLGGFDFQDSGVTFPLSGTNHRFKMGSTYGFTWNSLAGAHVREVQQSCPSKTVQPLKTNGKDSGYEHRYYNDLDRFHVHDNGVDHDGNTGSGNDVTRYWELNKGYWQKGHNPDDIGEGVTPILERYQKTGDEFYYFINQKYISLYTDSLIMPKTVAFKDVLPEGVELASNSLEDLTLYNIDGSIIILTNREWNYDSNTRTLTVTLSESNTNKINALSNELKEGDISLRVKVKVTKEAEGDINKDSMTNKATTIFNYEKNSYTAETNRVQTAVRKIDVEKRWEDDENQKQLRPESITVKLQKKTQGDWKDQVGEEIDLNDTNDWKGSFYVGSGEYRVIEKDPIDNYEVSYDKECKDVHESECSGFIIINTLLLTELEFEKVNQKGDKLTGAKFVLLDKSGKEIVEKDGEKIYAVSDEHGKVTFKDLSAGEYKIKEIEPPKGYELDDTEYSFEVVKEAEELTIKYGSEWKENGKVKNTIKPFNIQLLKTDNEENELPGAEFTIYRTDVGTEVDKVESDENGNVQFENLAPGSYKIKETKGIPGYEQSDLEIIVTIHEDGKVTLESSDGKTEIEYEVKLKEGKDNNLIEITTPFINEKIDYKLIVTKVDKELDEEGNKVFLEGATFVLLDESGNEILDEDGEAIKATSDENGKVTFKGLAIGKYKIKEVEAPEGYRLLTKPIDVEITGEDETVEIEVENSKTKWELPSSGGIGPTAFYAFGILLMGLVVLITLRRNKVQA